MTSIANSLGSDKIQTTLKKLKDEASEKESELIQVVSSIYDLFLNKKDQAIGKIKDHANEVNTSVHCHPWYYITGALAGGIFLGLLLNKR